MNPPASSARLLQNKTSAAFLANPKMASQPVEPMASQPVEPMTSHTNVQPPVNVKASQGKGQKSKTIKVNGLRFRVRLNDRSYRVMLLASDGEPYLCSFRLPEWAAVEHNNAAFLEKVKEKLRARIVKADDNEAAKLKNLLATIEEKSNGQKN